MSAERIEAAADVTVNCAASMGLRLVERGNTSISLPAWHRPGFNGAASVSAEESRRYPRSSATWLLQWGRVVKARKGLLPQLMDKAKAPLQWGRVWLSGKELLFISEEGDEAKLQWGRASVERGKVCPTIRQYAIRVASMGPRFGYSAERRTTLRRDSSTCWLQWGCVWWRRKGRSEDLGTGLRLASMGPRFVERGKVRFALIISST